MTKPSTLSLFVFLSLLAAKSFALNCPTIPLNCTLFSLDAKTHAYQSVAANSVDFVGVNDDEPSLPATNCEAHISLKTKDSQGPFIATVSGTNKLTGYFYIGKETGARDPQFSTEMIVNQKVTIYNQQQRMECELTHPSPQD